MPHSDPSPAFADRLEQLIRGTCSAFAWSYALLIAVIILQVVLRYGFSHGLVMLEELQWHLYATGALFGVIHAQVSDRHIRVDLLHDRLGPRGKALVEVSGILLLALPFIAVAFWHSLDFVHEAWRVNESSPSPSGLPWRWLIKSAIPVSLALLALAFIARLLRELAVLFSQKEPPPWR